MMILYLYGHFSFFQESILENWSDFGELAHKDHLMV